MGMYLNPGNSGFKRILKDYYVDKTGMIEIINNRINSMGNLICVSRPRRFGKSYAARMLCAYYDCTCKSVEMFKNLKVSLSDDYNEHLNQYNVIYLDIAGFVSDVKRRNGNIKALSNEITNVILSELIADRPELKDKMRLSECMVAYVKATEKKFVFIIDEWGAVIREAKNDEESQESYLDLLREWFKNGNFTEM